MTEDEEIKHKVGCDMHALSWHTVVGESLHLKHLYTVCQKMRLT